MAWMGWLSGPSFYLGPFSSVLGQSGPAPARAHACRPTSPRDPATCSCTGSIITKRLSCPLMLPLSPPKQRPSRTRDAVIRSYRTTHIWIQTTVSYKPMEPVSNNTTKRDHQQQRLHPGHSHRDGKLFAAHYLQVHVPCRAEEMRINKIARSDEAALIEIKSEGLLYYFLKEFFQRHASLYESYYHHFRHTRLLPQMTFLQCDMAPVHRIEWVPVKQAGDYNQLKQTQRHWHVTSSSLSSTYL